MSSARLPRRSTAEERPLLGLEASSSSSVHSPFLAPLSREQSPDRPATQHAPDERTSLLSNSAIINRSYSSSDVKTPLTSSTPRFYANRTDWKTTGLRGSGQRTPGRGRRTRHPSWTAKFAAAMQSSFHDGQGSMGDFAASKHSLFSDERVWYDQYTSTDWVHDSISDNFRLRDLHALKGIRGRLILFYDASQGWILATIVGVLTAFVAYFVDLAENAIFDIKEGYCMDGWFKAKEKCCLLSDDCPLWRTWGDTLQLSGLERRSVDLFFYIAFVVVFAVAASLLTLTTKTVVPSNVSLPTLDENLGYEVRGGVTSRDGKAAGEGLQASPGHTIGSAPPPMTYYPASGSGVAEVKVILSGFVLHGYLGVKTLFVKTFALILSVASGLSLGKEGPFVHIATCIGNVACRLFPKYRSNDAKRREILSASAASGVAVAFGAPLAGTLFSLEEVSYYFPPKTLFRTFFCCIAAALSLKFFDPYGTGAIVIFEVRYLTNWKFFEIVGFLVLGILGGTLGALFIKASRFWARTFRRMGIIKRMPILEVAIVALVTGCIQFWNKHTRQPVTILLSDLSRPCKGTTNNPSNLCPTNEEEFRETALVLAYAFLIKSLLTTITFGIKVPAGIYVPSMVVGGIMGRLFGHGVQYLTFKYPHSAIWSGCSMSGGPEACVTPGVYALAAAGSTMCGVTRLSVTLAVILFELTGSLDHVLPFSLAILVSKWTADALEPLSIYDLLTDMNHYPFLDNKTHPIFTSELKDITPRVRGRRMINISFSPRISLSALYKKLSFLRSAGEIDGGLPIVRDGKLVGLLPAPDLEYALDRLREQFGISLPGSAEDTIEDHIQTSGNEAQEIFCLMSADTNMQWSEDEAECDESMKVFDLTPYVDLSPVALDIHSPMDLVYQFFVKLGLRYVCVLQDGQYAGMVHKKAFVKYIRDLGKGKEI